MSGGFVVDNPCAGCPQPVHTRPRRVGYRLGPSDFRGNHKQTVDQGCLRGSGLLQKFCDLQLVEAAVVGRLPFVTHEQALGFRVKYQPPRILVGRPRPTPGLVKFTIDHRHVGFLPAFGKAYHNLRREHDRDTSGHTATLQPSASFFNVARKLRLRLPTSVVPKTSAWSSAKVPEKPLVTSCPANSGRTNGSAKGVC